MIGAVLSLYDRTPEEDPAALADRARIRAGHVAEAVAGATPSGPILRAAVPPTFVHDPTVEELAAAGVPSLAGLTLGVRAAAALHRTEPNADRLRTIAAVAATGCPRPGGDSGGQLAGDDWLGEHDTKSCSLRQE